MLLVFSASRRIGIHCSPVSMAPGMDKKFQVAADVQGEIVGKILSLPKDEFVFVALFQFKLDIFFSGVDPQFAAFLFGVSGQGMLRQQSFHFIKFQLAGRLIPGYRRIFLN
jgi:hypothetical protein